MKSLLGLQLKLVRRLALFFALTFSLGMAADGQTDERLVLRFDFTDVSGNNVKDPLSGITAKLMNNAKVQEMGKYHVLNLGNDNGYFDLTSQAGQLFASQTNYTLSMYYRVEEAASLSGAGYFLWAFSTQSACEAEKGAYSAYRLNVQRMANTLGGYANEVGADLGTASTKGKWIHVIYTQKSTTGKLYIDGELKKTIANMPTNAKMFASATPTCCWIGRAPFATDNYLRQTLVGDIRLYNVVLTDAEISALAEDTPAMDEAYDYGTVGDATALKTKVNEARALLAASADYLPDAILDLGDMTAFAETIAASGYSQAYIDKVESQLSDVISRVKSTKGIVLPAIDELGSAYDTSRGFVHPGGLHTQDDFDRIKKQLADGNEKVTKAYKILLENSFSQYNTSISPVDTVYRGGSGSQNYLQAARAAATAYQNALRWKIEGNEECAKNAVRNMMSWARTCKFVTGDSNYALAAGLYGYAFAQAGELMRDYEGWKAADFKEYKEWMLSVWYSTSISFLRGRNGTWENTGKWWQAPGHYWSNWGLCNALCVASVGILCDDVFVYNQGMSFFKYDQCNTFTSPRTEVPIKNNGLTEFLGNLVVTTSDSELETGAYGQLGQMNESGRDAGHCAMALGLAVDLAHLGWNQGDDLFAYMSHRLAAGIEFVAAQTQSVENLPWTNYAYATNGIYYTDGRCWVMQKPALPAHVRNYWGTVIGHYEGVKGVKMPFSEKAYEQMGIDGGAGGSTSGGYDHMGYSVLLNTRDEQLCPAEKVPTELKGKMEYSGEVNAYLIPGLDVEKTLGNVDGQVIAHTELGGLVNHFTTNDQAGVPKGQTVRLMPLLPEGEEDTGLWKWNTGENTRDITVATNKSYVYRATYTNKNGVESQICFAIAVNNDCMPATIEADMAVSDTLVTVIYGESATLKAKASCGWGTYLWSTGQTTESITTAPVFSARTYTVYYTSQGGYVSKLNFHVDVKYVEPYIIKGTTTLNTTEAYVDNGGSVTLALEIPVGLKADNVVWNTGDKGAKLVLNDLQESNTYTATFTVAGEPISVPFEVYVKSSVATPVASGNYMVRHVATDTYLTANGVSKVVTLEAGSASFPQKNQVWALDHTTKSYSFVSLADSTGLSTNGKCISRVNKSFILECPTGIQRYAISYGAATRKYWETKEDGSLVFDKVKELDEYPFELIPVGDVDGIENISAFGDMNEGGVYDLMGRKMNGNRLSGGIFIKNGKKIVVK